MTETRLSSLREPADTIGFAHQDWQISAVMERIIADHGENLKNAPEAPSSGWTAAICPHDDYSYAHWIYPAVLRGIRARTLVIFGVAHRAASFNIENQLILDGFSAWKGPFGPVGISPLREHLCKTLPNDMFVVHDTFQSREHSVEALLPFLQYFNRDMEIVSVLIPHMSIERMEKISSQVVNSIYSFMSKSGMKPGRDLALLMSSDAVHYGDREWGGQNYAPFGTDEDGTKLALAREMEIMDTCFRGPMDREKILRFNAYTVNPQNYREYRWTWCGRYSIPFGLFTALGLQTHFEDKGLQGRFIAYGSSISREILDVSDLGMGQTAIASSDHWVGYPAVGFF